MSTKQEIYDLFSLYLFEYSSRNEASSSPNHTSLVPLDSRGDHRGMRPVSKDTDRGRSGCPFAIITGWPSCVFPTQDSVQPICSQTQLKDGAPGRQAAPGSPCCLDFYPKNLENPGNAHRLWNFRSTWGSLRAGVWEGGTKQRSLVPAHGRGVLPGPCFI